MVKPIKTIKIPGASIEAHKSRLGTGLAPFVLSSSGIIDGNALVMTAIRGGTSRSTNGNRVTNQNMVSPSESAINASPEDWINAEVCA